MALRGPARSSHLPNTAADKPRKTMAMLKIQPRVSEFPVQSIWAIHAGQGFQARHRRSETCIR